jgi:Z1 domain
MLSDNGVMIENSVLVSLPHDKAPQEQQIHDLASRLRNVFPVSDDEFAEIVRRLHAKLAIIMDTGIALVGEDHAPWLSARKPTIDPYFADRFSKYLHKRGLPPRVLSTMDRVTDEILDLLGDPERSGAWARRGLVVGDVQSGKTATYTSICCKAGDAGYRLIILLTGTLESLRRQTQERLDEGFVGLDSSGELSQIRKSRAVGVGLVDARKSAGVFTSRDRDFSRALLNALGFRLDAFNVPVLVVVKKNKRILENLEKWLTDFNANQSGKIDAPVLVIDDEADSASVNTNPAFVDPTAINQRIRALLRLFTRSSYLGFTATPFANIFIDPETEHEMLGDDLFPRDFIYSLDTPSNYLGPGTIFGDQPSFDMLRPIDDAYEIFPAKHKSGLLIDHLPESLSYAVDSFLVACAIRDLRNEGLTHRSMLVNVSRFTAVQDQVATLIHADLSQTQQDIRNYSQLPVGDATKNSRIRRLRDVWQLEYGNTEFEWSDVQRSLLAAALPVVVKAVNQRTGAASLDYAIHRDSGLRVIAVGGNSLSRGLTLEGLSTSYFFRNSQMYDTLLQMGRWFGYRDGFADLCRLWLTDEAAQWYAHITLASEELRQEVKRMRQQGATPNDFGLKVRAHPDSLIVTAQNKMRQARTIERVISLSEQYLETPRLKSNQSVVATNLNALNRFVTDVRRAGNNFVDSAWGNPFCRGVSKEIVASLLRDFDVHPLNIDFQTQDLASYLERTPEPLLATWDVVIPNGSEPLRTVAGVAVCPARRNVVCREGLILVSGNKARVASRGVEREGLSQEQARSVEEEFRKIYGNKSISDRFYRAVREHPLLLVYVIAPYVKDQPLDIGGGTLVALGLSFPRFNDADVARRVIYRVNLVEWNAMLETEMDDDLGADDDESL